MRGRVKKYVGKELSRLLEDRLAARGWEERRDLYGGYLTSASLPKGPATPAISVVVISWRLHRDTLECLRLLERERRVGYELIFVDNGAAPGEFDDLLPHCDLALRLNENTGAYLARNLGAAFASGSLILFLEDDGLPVEGLLAAHLEAFRTYDCISIRGVYEPKTDSPFNRLAHHYDIGPEPFPQYVVAEGNAAYEARAFYAVGGWDDEIRFGGGGMELARRLTELEPDQRRQIYWPSARIRHDYVRDEEHLKKKRSTQKGSFERLAAKHPDLRIFRYTWRKFLGRTDLLVPRRPGTAAPAAGPERRDDLPPTLAEALSRRGWHGSGRRFTAFAGAEDRRGDGESALSVVVTADGAGADELATHLEILRAESGSDCEIILVGSPGPPLEAGAGSADVVVSTDPGASPGEARNLGAAFTRAPVILFLDGRSHPRPDLLEGHRRAHHRHAPVAVQGPVLARGDHPAALEAGSFYLGDRPFPCFADASDNHSYRADAFCAADGWGPEVHPLVAGMALSRELARVEPDLRRQIYAPGPVVSRDAVASGEELAALRRAFSQAEEELGKRINDLRWFRWAWVYYEEKEYLVPRVEDGFYEACADEALDAYVHEPRYPAALKLLSGVLEDFPDRSFTDARLQLWSPMHPPVEETVHELRRRGAEASAAGRGCDALRREPASLSAEEWRDVFRSLPWFLQETPAKRPDWLSIFCLGRYEGLSAEPPKRLLSADGAPAG